MPGSIPKSRAFLLLCSLVWDNPSGWAQAGTGRRSDTCPSSSISPGHLCYQTREGSGAAHPDGFGRGSSSRASRNSAAHTTGWPGPSAGAAPAGPVRAHSWKPPGARDGSRDRRVKGRDTFNTANTPTRQLQSAQDITAMPQPRGTRGVTAPRAGGSRTGTRPRNAAGKGAWKTSSAG